MAQQGLQQLQKQAQTLVLAPQLRQSLKILQAPALELRNVILEELQQNPSLEELPMEGISLEHERERLLGEAGDYADSGSSATDSAGDVHDELHLSESDYSTLNRLKEDFRDYMAQDAIGQGGYTAEDASRRQHMFDSLVSETSLQQHLLEQAQLATITSAEREALVYLIGSLDDKGFLTATVSEVAQMSHLPLGDIERAVLVLQSFDPPGIGARDIRDSLLLQLKLKGLEKSLAATILSDHYDLLLRHRLPEIARKCGTRLEQVQDAIEQIASLNPAPASQFAADSNRVIIPDVSVLKEDGEWHVVLNNDYIPRLRISPLYRSMIAEGRISDKDRDYIREQIRSGRFLISSIEQRQQTIERIARELLHLQIDFFEEGVAKLRPLTMSQMAQRIGVHETTISRAISGKYIETPYGVFEMKFFFTPGYEGKDGEALSNKSIKERVAQIIATEAPSKPYSDQDIADILAKEQITIARRTVAKYREQLGILPTNLRRRFEQ